MELGNSLLRKPKTRNKFSFFDLSNLTETDRIPNLTGVGWLTELGKWQNPKGFQ